MVSVCLEEQNVYHYRNIFCDDHKVTNTFTSLTDSNDDFNNFSSKRLQVKPWRFALAILYVFISHFTSSVSIVFAQEHLPDPKIYPPLPDILLDNLPYISWSYIVTEGVILFFIILGLAFLVFHKYRFLIIQRVLVSGGTVYIFRSICVMSTSLPIPQYHYDCQRLLTRENMAGEDRFINVGEGDTTEFINSMKNANTIRKTKSDISLFQPWLLTTQNEGCPFLTIENDKLNLYLARFFLSVRKKKGEEYEPDTLKSIQSSISRHLSEKSDLNILTDKDFQHSRDVLSAKKKDLKSKVLGNRKIKADAFTEEDIDQLYSRNLLGTNNPRCPVKTFKTYMKRMPTDSLQPDSKFYLSILPRYHNKGHDDFDTENTNIWYSMQPMGKNKLGELVNVMSEKGGLTGRKVDHSARKTTVTSFVNSHVEATTVMQLTRHKNVASINEYSSASLDQQIKMSNILSDIGSGGKSVCTEPAVIEKQTVNMVKSNDIDFENDDN
ncbi:SAMD8 [Mytilus coruscus]|uniref:SAMD8 n=1 Tax=Mytilus coruscus TaxID=42192 RepID=A0A6J8AH40_MYTCO|nr:SAMD8 [Mytilus coruscus]